MIALGLVVTACFLVLSVFSSQHRPGTHTPVSRLDAVWYDLRFQLWPPQRPAHLPIVIIDLDEATQQREGRWPWDRSKVAQLIQALQAHGTALIGFDVVFSEPGPNPARQLLDAAALPDPAHQALESVLDVFDGDAALARSLDDRIVLGYFFHEDGGKAGTLPPPFLQLPDDQLATSPLISLPDYTANLSVLTDHAWASGFVVAIPDADGIVRRVPLVMRHENGVYASLGLEMARLALAAPWVRLLQDQHGPRTIVTGVQVGRHLRVPLDQHGSMLVPYRGRAGSFTTVSATGVLRGDAPADQLAALDGALVLVGTSALGLSDLRTTPLQTGFPGVEIHANVLDTLLSAAIQQASAASAPQAQQHADSPMRAPFYLHPDWEPGASLALLLLSGLILALGLPGRSPAWMLAITSGWLTLTVAGNILLWQRAHLALPLALQLLLAISLGVFNIAGGYIHSNRQKRSIQNLFGEYVPAGHVERLLAAPTQINLDGEQRHMTVLFADVRNFTALSESLTASELKSVLNRYLSAITTVIFDHHGTIDKYVGDLVMAFWNAPLDDPQHAHHAVQAALAMQVRMQQLRQEFAQEGLPIFHIGIGINTGPMNVGDMGSSYRRAYTVLGDAVNLASRLEALTDFYGVPILVSDETRAAAPKFIYRSVDLARVKGRRQALIISQPLMQDTDTPPGITAPSGVAQPATPPYTPDATLIPDQTGPASFIRHLPAYEQAVLDYREQRWDQARSSFLRLAQQHPDDTLLALYLRRMADTDAPGSRWQAVYEHETKS